MQPAESGAVQQLYPYALQAPGLLRSRWQIPTVREHLFVQQERKVGSDLQEQPRAEQTLGSEPSDSCGYRDVL